MYLSEDIVSVIDYKIIVMEYNYKYFLFILGILKFTLLCSKNS